MARHFDGGFQDCSLQKDWHNASLKFREVLEGLYPVVTVGATHTLSRNTRSSTSFDEMQATPTKIRNLAPVPIEIDSNDEEPPKPSPSSRLRKRHHPSAQSTPQKIARMSEIPQFQANKQQSRKQFELEEIRGIRQDHYVGLPCETDPKATEMMIKLSMAHWEDPVKDFISRTGELCQNVIYERARSVFAHRQSTQFYSQLSDICSAFMTNAIDDQLKIAKQILSWELKKPKTLNEVAIEMEKDKAIEFLQKKRQEFRAKAWLDNEEEKTGKQSSGLARMDKIAKVTDAQLGPDPYALEIKAMGVSQSSSFTTALLTGRLVCASLL